MPCYKPQKGWLSRDGKVTFIASEAYKDTVKEVACGKCIGCRLENSRMWAVRCVHEAQMHEQNCFLTLTYAPEHLPEGGTLVPQHFTKFLKRLRKHIHPKKISYFHCGEYGDQLDRPHYHALLFGYEFPDARFARFSKSGHKTYSSELLDRLWGLGQCNIGTLNFETAAYTARYALKKITGDLAESHYRGRHPEYCTMSTKPAIGKRWLDQHISQVYRRDRIVINGKEVLPPRYYDKILRRLDETKHTEIKKSRGAVILSHPLVKAKEHEKKLTLEQLSELRYNRTKKRLAVIEESTTLKTNTFKRNL